MIKRFIGLVLSVLVVVGSISVDVWASSEKVLLTADEKLEISRNLDELEVPAETQEKLIDKLENGELWECMKEENVSAFNDMEFDFTPDTPVKRMVFKDGSVLQQVVDFENANIARGFSRNGDTVQTYSAMRTTYENVLIGVANGLSGAGFYATYVIDWNAHNDGIISVKDPYCKVVGGDYSEMSVTINQSYENYTKKKPAEATYSVHVTYLASLGAAETFIIKMYVGNDKMVYGKLGEVSFSY